MSRDKRRPKCPSSHPSPLHSRVSFHTSPSSLHLKLTLLPQDTSCLPVPPSTAAPLPSSFSPSAGTQPLLNNHYTLKPLSYPPLRSHFMVPCQRAPQPDLLICPGRLRPATRMRACGGVSQTRVATGTRAAVSRGRYCAGDGSNAPDQGAGKKWRLAFARVVVLGSLTLLFPTLFASNHAFQKRTLRSIHSCSLVLCPSFRWRRQERRLLAAASETPNNTIRYFFFIFSHVFPLPALAHP